MRKPRTIESKLRNIVAREQSDREIEIQVAVEDVLANLMMLCEEWDVDFDEAIELAEMEFCNLTHAKVAAAVANA